MKTVFALIFVAAVIGISQAVVCKVDSDCGADECCYIKPAFEVVSKRQLTLPVPTVSDTGVCERFHTSDEHCYPLETANGHCGCVTGTSCQWVPEPTHVTAGKRDIFHPPGPGAFKCAP